MKRCSGCDEVKRLDMFGANRTMPDGHQARCRSCRNEYARSRHVENRDSFNPRIRERNKKVRDSRRRMLASVKLTAGCIDCGYAEHPTALEFDHRIPSDKTFNVASDILRRWATVWQEIDKCDVRCANCHRIRTYS